jgi:DNA-binding FadR family transcriptional regulator
LRVAEVGDQILGVQGIGATKLAQRVARQIEEEIFAARLQPGVKIGSEPNLMEQHGISRTIFREAVRILEHDGIATMRRGPGGGLFVTDPDSEVVAHAAAQWLRFNDASVEELYAAREVLESRCATSAAEQIDEEGTQRLRAMIEREQELADQKAFADYTRQTLTFHETIAELSGNTVYLLFVKTLCELTPIYAASPAYQRKHVLEEGRAHRAIAEAIIAGDGAVASRRMITHLRAGLGFAERHSARSVAGNGRR